MTDQQVGQLEYDEKTGDTFLRLAAPYDNIIITPPYEGDAPASTAILNDRDISRCLNSITHPYTLEQAEEYLAMIIASGTGLLEDLKKGTQDGAAKILGGCPLTTIREVKEDGTRLFLGGIGVRRSAYSHLGETEEGKRLARENEERAVGDPAIEWELGGKPEPDLTNFRTTFMMIDYLAKSHHGRGIMTAVIRAVIYAWIVPMMGGRIVRASSFVENKGSIRVFEKLGFETEQIVYRDIVNACGDVHTGEHCFILRVP